MRLEMFETNYNNYQYLSFFTPVALLTDMSACLSEIGKTLKLSLLKKLEHKLKYIFSFESKQILILSGFLSQ